MHGRRVYTIPVGIGQHQPGQQQLAAALQALADVDDQELDLAHGDDAGIAAALDLPPAIPALRRQLLLARLVLAYADRLEADGVAAPRSPEQAARLAAALARLIDQVQAEGLGFGRLVDIVPADYAEHWGLTLRFLEIVTETWPQWLAEQDAVDPVTRRDALMQARAAAWEAAAPTDPVASTGPRWRGGRAPTSSRRPPPGGRRWCARRCGRPPPPRPGGPWRPTRLTWTPARSTASAGSTPPARARRPGRSPC